MFDELYERYKADVYRFLLKLCRNDHALADELTQEVFLKVYLNLDKFRGDSQFKTWLFTIAKNTFLSAVSKPQLDQVDLEVLDLLADGRDTVQQLEQVELMERVLEQVFDLPETMRLVFIARVYTDDSYEQIAGDLGISLSSSKVLMYRARQQLKKRLKERYGYDL